MSKRLLIGLFCGYLGLFALLGLLLPDRDFSPAENRVLAQRPALTWKNIRTGTFMADFETYVTDQFPLRDGWIAMKARAELTAGKDANKDVYLCGGDTLIEPYTAPNESDLDFSLEAVNALSESAGVPVVFALI